MLPRPLRAIWGDLSNLELKRFGTLALALMFTVGPYWMMRGIREALFIDLVGVRWQPWGKIASFVFVIPLILLYSKLIDIVKKEKLFSVIYMFYILAFLTVAFFIAYPSYHEALPSIKSLSLFSLIPGDVLGWLSYVVIESFGALAPALFWSFVASQTKTDSAKRGYGMILSITQIGTMSGSLAVAHFSEKLGLPIMIMIACAGIALVPFIINFFVALNPKKKEEPQQFFRVNKPKTGFFEGIRLLITHPYLFGIFIITTGYEAVGAILEYQMNLLGHAAYPTKEAFASFYGRYGFFTNGLAFLFALLGTSFFLRKFGLRICLLLFPIATGLIMCTARVYPVLSIVFISMIMLKGLSYSLNNPAKEILYIPTSKDAKFKAKGWIDVFGIRSIKASGAGINAFFRQLTPVQAIGKATPIVLAIVSVWLIVARKVSVKNHELVKEGKIIE